MTNAQDKTMHASGGCLCGGVRFSVHGPLRGVIACHCIMCRRLTSHYAAFTACAPDDLELTRKTKLRWYRSSPQARRGFCSGCGAQLFWEPSHGQHISISAGSLNEPSGVKMVEHIYTACKGDYYEITDTLPKYTGTGDPD